jgi:endonuclease/exonuclease/phosphatase (EEP) superfamily protein YafD
MGPRERGRRRPSRPRHSPITDLARAGTGAVLATWALSALLCIALAAPCPAAVRPWVAAALLSLSGLAWLGVAITQAGPPAGDRRLTAWDAALLAFAASFGVQSAARLGFLAA